MRLSREQREALANEIKIAREKMQGEDDQLRKIFFYSALFGATNRAVNSTYDPHVQFIDFVFQTSYSVIYQRIQAIKGGDPTVKLSEDFFTRLEGHLVKLEEKIRNDALAFDILQKISNLAFVTSGNGYYLLEKGVKMLED